MISILLILTSGILIGLLLISKPKLHLIINHLLNWSIYLLLFFLGISVGTNQEVLSNLSKLGYQAISIAVASITGSVILSKILFKIIFKSK